MTPVSLHMQDATTSIGFVRSQILTIHSTLASNQIVAIRNHMSQLRHAIRHQQAQLQHLEQLLQRAPRQPISSSYSPPPSPTLSDIMSGAPTMKRISSRDALQNLAGPDSSLPLPRRERDVFGQDGGIREGIPMEFGSSSSGSTIKRNSSPTRTLSRAHLHFYTSLSCPKSLR